MKHKSKFLLVLLLSTLLTSCGKDYIFVGNSKFGSCPPNTVMGANLSKNAYDIYNVSIDLYLGFSQICSEYEMTYCLYFENYEEDYEKIQTVKDYTKLKNHKFITSFSDEQAVELFKYSTDDNRIIYENSIDLKIDISLFKHSQGEIVIKAIGLVKTTDNNYKLNNLDANQIIRFAYKTDYSNVYLSADFDTILALE